MKSNIFIIVICMLTFSVYPDEIASKHKLEIEITVEWTKGNNKIDLFVAIPDSIEGRQRIESITYLTDKPFQVIKKDESSYAHFLIKTEKEISGTNIIKYTLLSG